MNSANKFIPTIFTISLFAAIFFFLSSNNLLPEKPSSEPGLQTTTSGSQEATLEITGSNYDVSGKVVYEDQGSIYAYDLDTQSKVELLSVDQGIADLSSLPDGRLYFWGKTGFLHGSDYSKLYLQDQNKFTLHPLPIDSRKISGQPVLSGDGEMVIFADNQSSIWKIELSKQEQGKELVKERLVLHPQTSISHLVVSGEHFAAYLLNPTSDAVNPETTIANISLGPGFSNPQIHKLPPNTNLSSLRLDKMDFAGQDLIIYSAGRQTTLVIPSNKRSIPIEDEVLVATKVNMFITHSSEILGRETQQCANTQAQAQFHYRQLTSDFRVLNLGTFTLGETLVSTKSQQNSEAIESSNFAVPDSGNSLYGSATIMNSTGKIITKLIDTTNCQPVYVLIDIPAQTMQKLDLDTKLELIWVDAN
jgi:hypothetical protein